MVELIVQIVVVCLWGAMITVHTRACCALRVSKRQRRFVVASCARICRASGGGWGAKSSGAPFRSMGCAAPRSP